MDQSVIDYIALHCTPQPDQIREAIQLCAQEAKSLMVAIALDIEHLETIKARVNLVDETLIIRLLQNQQNRLDEHRRQFAELYHDTIQLMSAYVTGRGVQ